MQIKRTLNVELQASSKDYLGFSKEVIFHPQNKKDLIFLFFLKINFFNETRIICCRTIPGHLNAKFQVDISIFGKHIAQKPTLLMTSFFQTVFRHFLHHTEIKMTFFGNPEIKLVKKHTFVFKNTNSKI